MKITKFTCIGHQCKVVQYTPHDFTILLVEGFGSTTYRPHWTVRQVRLAVAGIVFKHALATSANVIAPRCGDCGEPLEGANCHYCG